MQVMTNRDKLAPLIKEAKERHHHEIAIKYIAENKPKHWIEDNHELYHRAQILREELKQHVKDIAVKPRHKYLLFAHSAIMGAFFSSGVDEHGHLINDHHHDNCEAVPVYFN